MKFIKSAVVYLIVISQIISLTKQTCWLTTNSKSIIQSQITVLNSYQFSVHPTSSTILSKQYRDKTKQTVFFGDFGMLRMYGKDRVAVFQGLYMKIMPLVHKISPWLLGKYQMNNILELQVMYVLTFGKKQSTYYEHIGMSYFIVGTNISNMTQQKNGLKFVQNLISLEKGNKFKIEDYFKQVSGNIENNLYIYKAEETQLQHFLPLASDKTDRCRSIPWILQRCLIEIDIKSLQILKERFNIGQVSDNQTKVKSIKVLAARLRGQNKKQASIQQQQEQRQRQKQKQKQKQKNQKQKQSNSCPENQQL